MNDPVKMRIGISEKIESVTLPSSPFGSMVNMQILGWRILLSAIDLVNFLGNKRASYLDLRNLVDPVEIPERDAATGLGLVRSRRSRWA
jgi:hypothetical protein